MEDKIKKPEDERFAAFVALCMDNYPMEEFEARLHEYYRVCGLCNPKRVYVGNAAWLVDVKQRGIWYSIRKSNLVDWAVWGRAAIYRYY